MDFKGMEDIPEGLNLLFVVDRKEVESIITEGLELAKIFMKDDDAVAEAVSAVGDIEMKVATIGAFVPLLRIMYIENFQENFMLLNGKDKATALLNILKVETRYAQFHERLEKACMFV